MTRKSDFASPWLVALACIALASCSSPTATIAPRASSSVVIARACSGPASDAPAAYQNIVPYERTPDDDDGDLSKSVPGGFGGLHFVDAAHVTIWLLDPSQASAAKAALAAHFPGTNIAGASVAQARWRYDELVAWMLYIDSYPLLQADNITSMGIGGGADNRLLISVLDEPSRAALVADLNAANIPCDLVEISLGGYATLD